MKLLWGIPLIAVHPQDAEDSGYFGAAVIGFICFTFNTFPFMQNTVLRQVKHSYHKLHLFLRTYVARKITNLVITNKFSFKSIKKQCKFRLNVFPSEEHNPSEEPNPEEEPNPLQINVAEQSEGSSTNGRNFVIHSFATTQTLHPPSTSGQVVNVDIH